MARKPWMTPSEYVDDRFDETDHPSRPEGVEDAPPEPRAVFGEFDDDDDELSVIDDDHAVDDDRD